MAIFNSYVSLPEGIYNPMLVASYLKDPISLVDPVVMSILSHTKPILGAWNCERILFSSRQMNVISPSPPPPIKNEKTHVRFSTRRLVNDSDRLTGLWLNPLPGLACNINRCLAPSLALEHWVPEPTPFQMGCGVPQST